MIVYGKSGSGSHTSCINLSGTAIITYVYYRLKHLLLEAVFFARISRVRRRQKQAACLHARLILATYDEQREREMRSISSLLIRTTAESEGGRSKLHACMQD